MAAMIIYCGDTTGHDMSLGVICAPLQSGPSNAEVVCITYEIPNRSGLF